MGYYRDLLCECAAAPIKMATSASGVVPTYHNFFDFSDDSVEFSSDNDEDFEGFRYLNTQDRTVSFPTIELFVPTEDW